MSPGGNDQAIPGSSVNVPTAAVQVASMIPHCEEPFDIPVFE